MYVVKINGIVAHDPSLYDETKILASGTVSKKVNSADTFNFTIYPDNVCYNQIDSNSEVWVEVLKNGNNIFYGRVLKEETGWDNEKKITCEGLLALFNDSVLRPYEYQGSVLGYINYLVNQHNAQMNGTKQFIVRNVTVTDPNDNIVRSNSDYTKTITELIDKTAGSSLGGYLIVEYLNGAYYLDYLADSVQGTNQTLAFGENILDFQRSIDSESMATAIIPLGAKSDETGEYLTISSVNDGRDYIENSEAVSNRGLIFTTYRWEDVTVPANLLRKATALLSDLTRIVPKINLSAVDLTEAGYNIDEIGFFEYVTVSDTAHDVNGQYLITERTYDLLSPENDKVTFGSDDKTISGQSSRNQNSVAAVSSTVLNQARAIIEYQTELLKGGEGGYFVVGTDTDGHPSEIYFLDTNDKDTARSVLRINKNGIGFSTTGFDGPYTNAWTIDGNLNASYITTGILKDAATNGQKFSFNLETGEMHLDALDILVGGLYVGGRNLIINSLNAVISPAADRIKIIGQSGNTVVGGSAGATEHGIRSISTTPIRPYIRFGASSGSMNGLVAGQTYTFSADVSWVLLSNYTGTTKYQIRAAIYGNASGSMATQAYADIEPDCTTNKTGTSKCRFTFTVDSNTTEVYLYVYCNDTTASHYATTDYLEIANVKLETGEVATAWSPAYEDLNGYADHTAASQISAHDDEIYLAVSETYTSKEDSAVINMMPSIYSREYSDGKEYVSPTGITWTVNDDGSVTAKGTASSITWYSLTRSDGVTTGDVPPIKIDPDKKYTLSGGPAGSSGSTYKMFYRLYTDDTTHGSWISFNNKVTFGPNSKYVEIGIQIYANYTCPEEGITFYPMLEPGTIAHGYISPRNGTGAIGNLAKTNKASIDLQSNKIAMVVEEKNGQNVIKAASIVTAINAEGSSVEIAADHVNLTGYVTINSLTSTGTTSIDGSRITTGYISADRIESGSLSIGKLSDLNVGGRNYLVAISNKYGRTPSIQYCDYTYDESSATYVLTVTEATTSSFPQIWLNYANALPIPTDLRGKSGIFSCDKIECSNSNCDWKVYILFWNSSGSNDYSYTFDSSYTKYSRSITIPTTATRISLLLRVAQTGSKAAVGDTFTVRGPKFELGTVQTAWTPAPEDVEALAEAASDAANTANSRAVAYRGTCATAASTAAKVVTCSDFALAQGVTVTVYNTKANTYSTGALTLNVNSTGAKTVYLAGTASSSTNQLLWAANSSITYTYDGTYWRVQDNPGIWYGSTCSTAAGTAGKTSTVNEVVLFKGTMVYVPMTYENTNTSATLNISSTGDKAIYYGTGTERPTTSNGHGWIAGKSAAFVFDGAYWRISEGATLIDGGHIITGTIDASKINVTSLEAISAKIGGWNILSGALSKATANGVSGTPSTQYDVWLQAINGTPTASNNAIIARQRSWNGSSYGSWSSNFYVTYGGKLYAKNAEIEGKITSNSATITGGSINISSSSATASGDYIKLNSTNGSAAFYVDANGNSGLSLAKNNTGEIKIQPGLGIRFLHSNDNLAAQFQKDQTSYFDDDGTTRYTFTTSSGFTFYDANEAIISQFPANRADRVISNNGSAVSLASKTSGMTNLTNISLQHAGLYLLLCTVRFTTNATGYRFACLSTTSTGSSPVSWSAQVITQAVTGNGTYVSFPAFVNVSSATTYYLNARQNSGSAVSTTGFINAIKIA